MFVSITVLPSNKLTWLAGKWNLNEDLEDGDFTTSHVGLLECKHAGCIEYILNYNCPWFLWIVVCNQPYLEQSYTVPGLSLSKRYQK